MKRVCNTNKDDDLANFIHSFFMGKKNLNEAIFTTLRHFKIIKVSLSLSAENRSDFKAFERLAVYSISLS
jgi:hypothetical protein